MPDTKFVHVQKVHLHPDQGSLAPSPGSQVRDILLAFQDKGCRAFDITIDHLGSKNYLPMPFERLLKFDPEFNNWRLTPLGRFLSECSFGATITIRGC